MLGRPGQRQVGDLLPAVLAREVAPTKELAMLGCRRRLPLVLVIRLVHRRRADAVFHTRDEEHGRPRRVVVVDLRGGLRIEVREPGLEERPRRSRDVVTVVDLVRLFSAERVRDELDKLITVEHPSAGLWFAIDTGLADEFLPELPAMRLEQDPIHRHKDVLTHTLAVVENVRPDMRPDFDFRRTRLAALFHDVGKPQTRGYQQGKGVTFHHHDAVGARMTRKRLTALRYSHDDVEAITELVALHLRFHTYQMGWTDSAVRRYVRDAGGLLAELNVLTRCDCTTRNERKAAELSKRMDELEARISELAQREELASIRPELDGTQVMEHLGIGPGPRVGKALAFLLEIRLDEGMLGEDEIRRRLDQWRIDHEGC